MSTKINRAALLAAEHLHKLGFNVTSIPQGGKEPSHPWNNKRAPWATERQPLEVVRSFDWSSERRIWNGEIRQPVETIGVINGIANLRTIDVDAITQDGVKVPVPTEVRAALLNALGLPLDYEWSGLSKSGAGLHILIAAAGDLPESWRSATKDGERGVIIFEPLPAYVGMFDHIELRWAQCQTTLPRLTGYNGHLPDVPPTVIDIASLVRAFEQLTIPRLRVQRPVPSVSTQRTEPSVTKQHNDVIGAFNAAYRVEDIIERNGYTQVAGGWTHPQSSQPGVAGVKLEGDKVRSFSATDPLNDGQHAHDAFSAFCTLEHSSNISAAVKAAADLLGLGQQVSTNDQRAAAIAPGAPTSQPGPVTALANALESAGYHFQLETETQTYFLNGQRLSDHSLELLRARVADEHLGKLGHIDSAIAQLAERHKFARIHDRLHGLVWDGQSHIARLAQHLQTRPGDVITYQDGTKRRVAEAFLRRWLIGAVGRIFDREQNLVLVLAGAQDAGKSRFARWLGSILPEAYYEGRFEPEAKDTTLRMIESLVWEIGELDGVTSKHAAAILKLMLTQEEVIARRPYGRFDIRGPVRASFIGTVNDDGDGFLIDPTGNRRYMVISLTGIDWNYTQIDVAQVWAEAVALYRAGERGRPNAEERAWRDKVNAERHEMKGPLFDHIAQYFTPTGDDHDVISNADIYDILVAHGVIGRLDRKTEMDVAQALKRIGAKKAHPIKANGRSIRCWRGLKETTLSSQKRSVAGPSSVGDYGVIELEPDDYNLSQNEVVIGVVAEVVAGHQDAKNNLSSTTSTTFSLKKEKSEEAGAVEPATNTESEEKRKVSENAREVVEDTALAHTDAAHNLSDEVVTGVVAVGVVVPGSSPTDPAVLTAARLNRAAQRKPVQLSPRASPSAGSWPGEYTSEQADQWWADREREEREFNE
jgi:hypothetical protein